MKPMKTTVLEEPILLNPGDKIVVLRYEDYRYLEKSVEAGRALAIRALELLNLDGEQDIAFRDRLTAAAEVFNDTVWNREI